MIFLKKVFNIILDYLFPQKCLGCFKVDESYICSNCLSKIPLSKDLPNDFTTSVFDYKNKIIKKALWIFKFQNGRDIADLLSKNIYALLLEELADQKIMRNFTDPILIPIPLSKKSFRKRGYNQTELVIDSLYKLDQGQNFSFEKNVLFKDKETTKQADLKNRKERLENLKNCFSVKNENLIKNRNIVLIDDITTTGATLVEAKKVLKKHGVKKVIAITIAH